MGVYFKLLTPGGPTEEQQEHLAKMTSGCEDWLFDVGVPFGSRLGERICCNFYEDPPDSGLSDDRDSNLWTEVEAIDISNYTPGTVRRIRSWLLGSTSAASASSLICDHDLMKVLLTAAGTANRHIELGYYWPQTSKQSEVALAQLKADGVWDEVGKKVERISWLDYQTRLATRSQKLIDSYYQPYNDVEAKAAWGRAVLERLDSRETKGSTEKEENDGSTEEEEADGEEENQEDEIASLRKSPHLVWTLAKQKALPWTRSQEDLMDMLSSLAC